MIQERFGVKGINSLSVLLFMDGDTNNIPNLHFVNRETDRVALTS